MNHKKNLAVILFFSFSIFVSAQHGGIPQDTCKTSSSGKKQGFWKETSMGLAFYGYYVDDKKEGNWVCYHPGSSLPQFVDYYHNGRKNGISIANDAYANFMKEEYYTNDTLDGQSKYFFDNSKLKSLTTYKMGVLNGPKKVYYQDGKPQEEANFVNGKKDGIAKWYFGGGILMTEYTYKNGKLEGSQKNYYKTGKVQNEVFAVNNEFEGVMTEYYESGKPKATVTYVHGKRQGLYKATSEDGKTITVTVKYKDDVMDGEYKEMYADGKPKLDGKYVMGKKQGAWKSVDDKGVMTTVMYKDDQPLIKTETPPKK